MAVFLADRTDGLGERLRSLFNAYELARISGGEFRFNWPPMYKGAHPSHAVRAMEETFSSEFITAYAVEKAYCSEPSILDLSGWDALPPDAKQRDVVVRVGQSHLAYQAPTFFRSFKERFDFATTFLRIGFRSDIREAIEFANQLNISHGAVALHLRAGDIVFGEYRFSDRFHEKVVDLPIAEAYAQAARAKGRPIIVFGQDKASIDLLVSDHGALRADALCSECGFSALQQALFEIMLMSRCSEILAGISGFSKVASMIGGTEIVDPRKVARGESFLLIVQDFLRRDPPEVHDLVKAFACRSACLAIGEVVPQRPDALELMETASRLDPENPNYTALLAVQSYRNGQNRRGEQLLYNMLDEPDISNSPIDLFLSRRSVNGDLVCSATHEQLKEHAVEGNPVAALYLAIARKALGDAEGAEAYLACYARHRLPEQRSTCDAVLHRFDLNPSQSAGS